MKVWSWPDSDGEPVSMQRSRCYFRFFGGFRWARSLPATLLTDLGVLGWLVRSLPLGYSLAHHVALVN